MRKWKIGIFMLGSLLMIGEVSAMPNILEKQEIGLKNPEDNTLVYCHKNRLTSAEDCAKHFEKQGFIRFSDIPYKTANYDFLKVDTYPTRRWRPAEVTPRW